MAKIINGQQIGDEMRAEIARDAAEFTAQTAADTALCELAILRVAQLTGSDYVWRSHYRLATRAGVTEQQLAENKAARARTAQEVDPAASEDEVIDRIKTDHPADFAAALDSYRTAMGEARQFVIDHDIASMPAGPM